MKATTKNVTRPRRPPSTSIAFSPAMEVDGGLRGRVTFFVVAFTGVLFPAGLAAGLGYVAGQFVPDESQEPEEADETGETPG